MSNFKFNEANKATVKRVLDLFEWIYEYEILKTGSSRQLVLDEMKKYLDKLKTARGLISVLQAKISTIEQNMLKRLEWTCASNPGLIETIKHFESQRNSRKGYLKVRAN